MTQLIWRQTLCSDPDAPIVNADNNGPLVAVVGCHDSGDAPKIHWSNVAQLSTPRPYLGQHPRKRPSSRPGRTTTSPSRASPPLPSSRATKGSIGENDTWSRAVRPAVAAGAPGETRTPTPLRETDFESLGVNVSILLGRQNSPVFQAVIGIFAFFLTAPHAGTFSQPPCTITRELHTPYPSVTIGRGAPNRRGQGGGRKTGLRRGIEGA